MIAETIHWRMAADELPDADTTVLVFAPGASEPVWLGYYDGVFWFEIGGGEYGEPNEIPQHVIAWGYMPSAEPIPLADPIAEA